MYSIVCNQPEVIGPWVCGKTGGTWTPGRGTALGLLRNREIIAGVIYEDFNGANCLVHVASTTPEAWKCREFLWFAFYYPFEQLGCTRLTGVVPDCNEFAKAFDERLGFKLEYRMHRGHPKGDLLIYGMYKEDCRWLRIRGKNAHKTDNSGRTGSTFTSVQAGSRPH